MMDFIVDVSELIVSLMSVISLTQADSESRLTNTHSYNCWAYSGFYDALVVVRLSNF